MNNSEIREQLIQAREEYINLIKAELMGPGSELSAPDAEHELLSSSPVSRYSVGILFPQGNKIEHDNDETVSEDDDEPLPFEDDVVIEAVDPKGVPKERALTHDETADENLDEEISMATQYKPSSMGITFFVKGNPDVVHCGVSFATYRHALIPDCVVPFIPNNADTYIVPPELAHIYQIR